MLCVAQHETRSGILTRTPDRISKFLRRQRDRLCGRTQQRLDCKPPLKLNRNQPTMRKFGRRRRRLKNMQGTAAFRPRMQLRKITIRLMLTLFSSCTFAVRSDAQINISIDKVTGMFSAERTSPDDRYLRDPPRLNRTGIRAQVDHITCKTAEQFYDAASADARTLERVIFISAFRQEVEHALGRRLTDDELRALADQAREEAHQWYKYLQTDRRCAAR